MKSQLVLSGFAKENFRPIRRHRAPGLRRGRLVHRARLRGPLLELSLAHEENVHLDREASERTIQFHEFLVTVGHVFFYDQRMHVAPRIRVATGPRSKQDDLLRMGCRHE
jgi:hypothetical protein